MFNFTTTLVLATAGIIALAMMATLILVLKRLSSLEQTRTQQPKAAKPTATKSTKTSSSSTKSKKKRAKSTISDGGKVLAEDRKAVYTALGYLTKSGKLKANVKFSRADYVAKAKELGLWHTLDELEKLGKESKKSTTESKTQSKPKQSTKPQTKKSATSKSDKSGKSESKTQKAATAKNSKKSATSSKSEEERIADIVATLATMMNEYNKKK